MAMDVSGLEFFLPIFSFLFVFIIVYALLFKTKVLGENKFILFLISFIMGIVFISFSSMELFVRTIMPWAVVLIVVVFLVLLIAGMASKDLGGIMKPWFAWIFIAILIIIFLIAAIKVFNPVFHPDLAITSGEGTSLIEQIRDFGGSSRILGTFLLIIAAVAVSWILVKMK